jgi:PAS domain-containing protein
MDKTIIPTRETNGAVTRYVGMGADITARKHAEEALLKAGALQSAIFKSANFSSIATDAKGVIQIFNVGAGVDRLIVRAGDDRWTYRAA